MTPPANHPRLGDGQAERPTAESSGRPQNRGRHVVCERARMGPVGRVTDRRAMSGSGPSAPPSRRFGHHVRQRHWGVQRSGATPSLPGVLRKPTTSPKGSILVPSPRGSCSRCAGASDSGCPAEMWRTSDHPAPAGAGDAPGPRMQACGDQIRSAPVETRPLALVRRDVRRGRWCCRRERWSCGGKARHGGEEWSDRSVVGDYRRFGWVVPARRVRGRMLRR